MTQSTQQPIAIRSVFLKSLLGISFAALLSLAPAPAFAQHGGGGGGGAHGGGGGGGSHAGNGGGHGSGSGSGSHPTSNGSSTGNTAAGHWWNPFHGNGAAPKAGGTGSGANAGNSAGTNANTRFAAGNNTWQDPPANARANTPSHFFANSNSGTAASANRTLHRPMPNGGFGSGSSQNAFRRRPIIIFPFNPFLFGNGFGFGYGFGCDPWLWGCPPGLGFGFGFGDSFGYYGGGAGYGYAGGSDMTFQYNGTEPDATSGAAPTLENNGDWQNAPENNSQLDDSKAQPWVVIFLRDGSSYAVSDYWLAGGKLHYVTSYGGENSVDANQLDLQRTVTENSAHGVTFTLRPAAAAGAPNGKQPLQPARSNDSQTPAPNPQ